MGGRQKVKLLPLFCCKEYFLSFKILLVVSYKSLTYQIARLSFLTKHILFFLKYVFFLFAVRNSIYSWHFIKDNILVIPFNLSQDKWITNKQSFIGLALFPSFFACNILAGTSSLFALSFRISHYHSVLTLLTSHFFLILWRSQILFFRASVFISFLCPTTRQKAYIQQHSADTPHPWTSSQFCEQDSPSAGSIHMARLTTRRGWGRKWRSTGVADMAPQRSNRDSSEKKFRSMPCEDVRKLGSEHLNMLCYACSGPSWRITVFLWKCVGLPPGCILEFFLF